MQKNILKNIHKRKIRSPVANYELQLSNFHSSILLFTGEISKTIRLFVGIVNEGNEEERLEELIEANDLHEEKVLVQMFNMKDGDLIEYTFINGRRLSLWQN